MRRGPYPVIFVVASHSGALCNFADTREVALELAGECEHGHDEPHHVYRYQSISGKPLRDASAVLATKGE